MYTVGNIVNFVSLSFTPQSLLAGLGSSQFLMNAVCEWYLNGVRITARMVKATVLIIIGNTLIVAFASHESPKLTVDELLSVDRARANLSAATAPPHANTAAARSTRHHALA